MRYIILPLCALCVMIVFQSCKQTVSEKQEEVVSECLREKNEGVSMRILKKMECLYGDDISGGKAFSVDSKSCPEVFIWMIPEGWLFRLREIRLLSANGWKKSWEWLISSSNRVCAIRRKNCFGSMTSWSGVGENWKGLRS